MTIDELWQLADLPSYDHSREENRHRVVVLERISSEAKAKKLVERYLEPARDGTVPGDLPLYPFTEEAIDAVFRKSDGKPRDILRLANALIETGAEENWETIDGPSAQRVLMGFHGDDGEYLSVSQQSSSRREMWSE